MVDFKAIASRPVPRDKKIFQVSLKHNVISVSKILKKRALKSKIFGQKIKYLKEATVFCE